MTDPRLLAVARDDVHLSVRDRGPLDGEPVVLLHGFPQDSSCWDEVVPPLHDAGLRTLVPDQRGYAPSSRPSGVAPYRLEELTADVLALLDAAGLERAHVVGHDWGGVVAWELAARHPDRVSGLTVLSTPHPAAFAWSLTRSRQAALSWYALAFQVPRLPELLLAHSLEPVLRAGGLPAEHARRYAHRLASPERLGPPLAWYRALGRAMSVRRSGATPAVTVPTTFVWGRRDPTFARAGVLRTREHVTGAYRFVELDAGHWLPECRPAVVAQEVVASALPARGRSARR